jgi:hypothetical protein
MLVEATPLGPLSVCRRHDECVRWAVTKPSLAPLYARYPARSRRSANGCPPKARFQIETRIGLERLST